MERPYRHRHSSAFALAAASLAAMLLHTPAQAQIIGVPQPLKIEVLAPLEGSVAVYQKMAPSKIDGPHQARVHLQMRITNQTRCR